MTWPSLALQVAAALAHLALAPFFLYLLALTVSALAYRRRRPSAEPGASRFLFVIPAHNEEAGVGDTVASCLASRYPRDRFDVLAIADNCADATARVARDAGARVVERFDADKKSKGYALEYLFQHLAETGEDARRDAVVVVDADTLIDADLLNYFDRALVEGKDWLQCYYTVSNPDRSWRTRLMTYAFSLINGVWSVGQEGLGLGSSMRGNGMMFSMKGLKRHPFEAYGLTEDLEFAWRLRIAGERAHFVPETQVMGEMVSQGGASAARQRQRWEVGRAELKTSDDRPAPEIAPPLAPPEADLPDRPELSALGPPHGRLPGRRAADPGHLPGRGPGHGPDPGRDRRNHVPDARPLRRRPLPGDAPPLEIRDEPGLRTVLRDLEAGRGAQAQALGMGSDGAGTRLNRGRFERFSIELIVQNM